MRNMERRIKVYESHQQQNNTKKNRNKKNTRKKMKNYKNN